MMDVLFYTQDKGIKDVVKKLGKQYRCHLVTLEKDLMKKLKTQAGGVVILDYDEGQTALELVNQQILSQYPTTKRLVLTSEMNGKEIKKHQRSSSAAEGYLLKPLEAEMLVGLLEDIEEGEIEDDQPTSIRDSSAMQNINAELNQTLEEHESSTNVRAKSNVQDKFNEVFNEEDEAPNPLKGAIPANQLADEDEEGDIKSADISIKFGVDENSASDLFEELIEKSGVTDNQSEQIEVHDESIDHQTGTDVEEVSLGSGSFELQLEDAGGEAVSAKTQNTVIEENSDEEGESFDVGTVIESLNLKSEASDEADDESENDFDEEEKTQATLVNIVKEANEEEAEDDDKGTAPTRKTIKVKKKSDVEKLADEIENTGTENTISNITKVDDNDLPFEDDTVKTIMANIKDELDDEGEFDADKSDNNIEIKSNVDTQLPKSPDFTSVDMTVDKDEISSSGIEIQMGSEDEEVASGLEFGDDTLASNDDLRPQETMVAKKDELDFKQDETETEDEDENTINETFLENHEIVSPQADDSLEFNDEPPIEVAQEFEYGPDNDPLAEDGPMNSDSTQPELVEELNDEHSQGFELDPSPASGAISSSDLENLKKDSHVVMVHHNEELLKISATLRSLREEREHLREKINSMEGEKRDLQSSYIGVRSELDDVKIELELVRKRYVDDIENLKYSLKLANEKQGIFEEKARNYRGEMEKLGSKVRLDYQRVTEREKELENQLDLLKADAQTQVKTRDDKILELKRKIDSLEFNMENVSMKELKSREDKYLVEEKLDKVMKTLRIAIGVLESDEVSQNAREVIKKLKI